jgi:hypothetical protein
MSSDDELFGLAADRDMADRHHCRIAETINSVLVTEKYAHTDLYRLWVDAINQAPPRDLRACCRIDRGQYRVDCGTWGNADKIPTLRQLRALQALVS